MMRQAMLLACLCAIARVEAAAPCLVDGKPVCGSFAVTWLPDELRQAQQAGINLVYCYDRRAGAALLDPGTELGAIALQGGTGVMANFLRFAHGLSLTADIGPQEAALPIGAARMLPETGTLWIDDEAITYASHDDSFVSGCTRGAMGTTPAAHAAGTFLLEEGMVREAMQQCRNSPNLWGFWVLDDKKGNQLPALRNLYRLIRELDVDEAGRPLNHVVVAGYANEEALTNFDAGACDAAGIYIYPARRGTYHVNEGEQRLRVMVPTLRERDPNVAVIGIYQAFYGGNWDPKPTPLQLRQQTDDYLRWGAAGIMAYSWRMVEGHSTLHDTPDLREEVTRIAAEIASGALTVNRTPPVPAERPVAHFDTGVTLPLLAFTPETPGSPSKGLLTETGPLEGRDGTWLHLRFEKYEVGGNEWPGVGFTPGTHEIATTDWSPYAGLVVRVANLQPGDSECGVTLHAVTGMWARYYPLVPGVQDVVVDLGEVRTAIPIGEIKRLSVIMRRPPEETHLALGGFHLLPMQFAPSPDHTATVPRAATPPGPEREPWAGATRIELADATGERPLKPCTVMLLRGDGVLHVRIECAVPDPALLRGDTTEPDAAMAGEDLVEVLLRPEGAATVARLCINPAGAVRDELLQPDGADLAWRWGAQVHSVRDDRLWTVMATLPLTAWDAPGAARWEANFRRVDTELRPLAWVTEHRPGYEVLGTLTSAE